MVESSKSPRDFNQGLMELGALICTPLNPSCGQCPLRRQCAAYADGRVDELPAAEGQNRPRASFASRLSRHQP